MVATYEDVLIEHLLQLNKHNFQILFSSKIIFVCGGPIDGSSVVPTSFRHRFFDYARAHFADISKSLIKAESFKDYFLDGHYNDLLVFEDDIARISTLVLIFLESPGSLVELGMFVSKREVYKKLLIVAPHDKVQSEDSFIYLGPLRFISAKDEHSLAVYDWPDDKKLEYDNSNLFDLCKEVEKRLSKSILSDDFDEKNSSHLALLICQIIQLASPIQISEIELALEALDISLTKKDISRYLYLSIELGLVEKHKYGPTHHYYYSNCDEIKVKFGKNKNKKTPDLAKFRMSLRQSMINGEDDSSRRRQSALRSYIKLKESEE